MRGKGEPLNGELVWEVLASRARGDRALLLTGPIGSGKTQAVLALAEELRRRGLRVGGVASPRVLAGVETVGYRVHDLGTGEERPLCSREPPGIPFRRFFFSPQGLDFANGALARTAAEAEVAFVDEVGPLELGGGGFAPGLRALLRSQAFLVLTVRPSLVEEVRRWAGLGEAPVLSLAPPLTRARDLFDRASGHYERWTEGTGVLSGYGESLARVAGFAQVGPGERLLDIGIGTGEFASRVAVPGVEVWGVDPSPGMLARCREKHPNFILREGHFLSLPVPDGFAHAVISSFAFHHLVPAEYEGAFREVLRVLVPGGRFILLDVMFPSEADRKAARVSLGGLWDDEEVYPLVPEVEAAAAAAGARDVTSHRVGAFHWVVTGARPGGRRSGAPGAAGADRG